MSIKLSQALLLGACLSSSTWLMAAVKEYHLTIDEQLVNVTGKPLKRITVNGKFPAPLLEFEEGDEAVIHVYNKLKNEDSSLHWHGLLLPALMDGVPSFNGFQGIKPGGHFEYRFKIRQNGTYWYHAHSKGQEQDGLYGAFVVYPKDHRPAAKHEQAERDYVVMLSDFHQSKSDQILNNLKKSAEYYQNRRETLGDVWQQVKREGWSATWKDRSMWNRMRMLKTDLSDVTGYTFLVNGKTPKQNWTGLFKSGEKVRLRFINASAMSFFDVRIPGLKMHVVSADGQPVQPVPVDEFRIGTAETYDAIVEPKDSHYQIEAESIDRTGFALASLHDQADSARPATRQPDAKPRALLTMADMGMQHGGHNNDMANQHAGHMSNSDAQGEIHSQMPVPGTDHAAMDHSKMMTSSKKQEAAEQRTMSDITEQRLSQSTTTPVYGWANASTPAGHKALTYADLKSLNPQSDQRQPEQELVIRLGGNMERYVWTMNGKKFTEAEPLQVKYGERVRLKFINDSMMAHPMHLHGMFMQLENGQPLANMPNKHTVIVPPGQTVTALLTADELGEWAIHCHLLYHMSTGMMNKLVVAQVGSAAHTPAASHSSQGAGHAHH